MAGAANLYRQALAQAPDKKTMIYIVADGLRDCGFWAEGLAILQQGSQRWPQNIGMLSRLSQAYFERGDYKEAANCLDRFLERVPGELGHWQQLGELRMRSGEFEKAERAFDRILSIDPLNVVASVGRGDALWQQHRIGESVEAYRRAIAIEPENANGLFKIGLALFHTGSAMEAGHFLQRSLQINPHNIPAYGHLSLALSATGQFGTAADIARVAVEADANAGLANYALGKALIGLGDFDNAAESLKRASDAAPRDKEVLLALADAETSRDQPFGAERALQQLLALEPSDTSARFMLAALHGEALQTPPPDFAREAFDRIALSYDAVFGAAHAYRTPVDAALLLEDTFPDQSTFKKFADLGCGTGLTAFAMRDAFRIEHATGIDVSARMIEQATPKELYDRLMLGDATETLGALKEQFDLVTAIEILPYVGDLSAMVRSVAASLARNGLFICSIERSDQPPYALRRTRRFAHDVAYLKDLAQAAGLQFVASRPSPTPRYLGTQSEGELLLFRGTAS
ncbi:MAG: tetratricopeptide repeat protein [Rhodospirillaceae bacterium]